ncbi:2-(1,2-epoxy-1,2-dihydrophenyl)acetyl-CoA isomerase [Marininema mesophilum]|uniref:2-(1,2-epoxy-1,2-dihydrophenyl)acetyl-CoA isomerase n=1 Tax=Marininema mesophilum TaxID=1048340 RepID=A0A1H3BDR2_9BACL|nr:enoyl-CoA hydratase-related protein [Marininema mesophilum]SDX40046.1 2-(1,2-epoxy-1,2-dihydrophenyl)acetyl-CoA isomerase [Marininema mesophilum]
MENTQVEQTVTLLKEDGVGIITLNRPHLFNAFNTQLNIDLLAALKDVGKDPEVRAVIITGAGKAFCSGQDLSDRSAVQGEVPSLGDSVRKRYNPLILAMTEMEKPIIAAVNGAAAGAGCSLALACDMRFISDRGKFVEAFVRIGLAPDSGSSWFLSRLVGVGRAMELAMTGRNVGAEEAVQIGLANKLVPHDRLLEETLAFAKQLAQGPTRAIGLTKRALYKALDTDVAGALEYEAQVQEIAGKTKDFHEGITSFLEKRPPRYRGE